MVVVSDLLRLLSGAAEVRSGGSRFFHPSGIGLNSKRCASILL